MTGNDTGGGGGGGGNPDDPTDPGNSVANGRSGLVPYLAYMIRRDGAFAFR